MGKNGGGSDSGIPKYRDACRRSDAPSLALAGKVQGGLFPTESLAYLDNIHI
jgi:hypothetical protein